MSHWIEISKDRYINMLMVKSVSLSLDFSVVWFEYGHFSEDLRIDDIDVAHKIKDYLENHKG